MKLFIVALFFIVPTIVFAQSNYQPGYVLKNNGDTVKGFIDYREWGYSPLTISFKANKSTDAVQQFAPTDIRAFKITGFEDYLSYIGTISTNKNVFPDLPSGLDTSVTKGAIFLKQLTTGVHVKLFYNNEFHKDRFFIAEQNQMPAELKYYEYYDNAANGDVVNHNAYRGQLGLYVYKYNNGDKKLLSSIEQTRFDGKDLEELVNKINNVTAEQVSAAQNYVEGASKVRVFAGLGVNSFASTYSDVGTSSSTNVLGGTNITPFTQVFHSKQSAPKMSAGIDVFFNPNVQQFIFRAELGYTFFSAELKTPANTSTTTYSALSFSQYSFALVPQIIYNAYNTDKFKLYVDVGLALNSGAYSDNKSGKGESAGYKAFLPYVPLQAGLVLYKKIEIYFSYTSFTTTAYYTGVTVSNKMSMGFGVKLLFD